MSEHTIDPDSLFNRNIANGYYPDIDGGPRGIPLQLDFTTDDTIHVHCGKARDKGVIQIIQSIYVDNSENPNPLVLTVYGTNQRLKFPANSCLTQAVFVQDPGQFKFTTTASPTLPIINAILLNVPIAPASMGPIAVTSSIVLTGTWTNAAVSSITAGGVSQALFAANANRKGLFIQNPANATESIWIEFTGVAVMDVPSIEITPGGNYSPGVTVSTQAITIIAATLGHKFTAKELS